MRERYKEEIKSISEELEREKMKMGDIQTENRHLQHELDMLKVRNNVDTLDPSWGSFKVRASLLALAYELEHDGSI